MRATQMPNTRQTAPNSSPWAMASQTAPSATVMANSDASGSSHGHGPFGSGLLADRTRLPATAPSLGVVTGAW